MDALPAELLWSIWKCLMTDPAGHRSLPRLAVVCRRFRALLPSFAVAEYRLRYTNLAAPPHGKSWLRLLIDTATAERAAAVSAPPPSRQSCMRDPLKSVTLWAIREGYDRVLQRQLSEAPDTAPDPHACLLAAIENDQVELVRLLLPLVDANELGGRLIYPDMLTATSLCIQVGNVLLLHTVISYMLARGVEVDMLALFVYAARVGAVNILEHLHCRGVAIDGTKVKILHEEHFVTNALIEATIGDEERAVGFLLAHGASPDLLMPGADGPLVIAVQTHNLRIAIMLLAAGASTAIADRFGVPLMELAMFHAPCIARLLTRINMRRQGRAHKRRASAPDLVSNNKVPRET